MLARKSHILHFVGLLIRKNTQHDFHALWDMLQAAINCTNADLAWVSRSGTIHRPCPAQSPHPWRKASLRQGSLGKEIGITATESATINQLPQSGISRGHNSRWDPDANPKHDRCYNHPN